MDADLNTKQQQVNHYPNTFEIANDTLENGGIPFGNSNLRKSKKKKKKKKNKGHLELQQIVTPDNIEESFSFREYGDLEKGTKANGFSSTKMGFDTIKEEPHSGNNTDNDMNGTKMGFLLERENSPLTLNTPTPDIHTPYAILEDGKVCIVPGRLYWHPLTNDIKCEFNDCERPAY